jgi:hypothetical protein
MRYRQDGGCCRVVLRSSPPVGIPPEASLALVIVERSVTAEAEQR